MKKVLLASAAALAFAAGAASASVSGNVAGPPGSFTIDLAFGSSLSSITSLSLNGSTATAFPILWDSVGTVGGTAVVSTISGVDTQIVDFAFSSFGAGDTLTLSGVDPDGDPGPVSVTAGELAGVSVSAVFSNGSIYSGSFVDDVTNTYALVLEGSIAAVPVPPAVALGGLGLLALGAYGRRQRRKAA